MNLKELFITIYSVIIFLLITLCVSAILMYRNNEELDKGNIDHYKSFVIADELRQSSDDLTRYCRTYVLTGDSIWEEKYWEVLDIRNGKSPRSDGKTIALQDSMRKLGFTKPEFDKLKESEQNSNDLVWTEKIAFHAMKGLFVDDAGQFSIHNTPDTIFARTIMFDEKYHYNKSIIMQPIDDFMDMVEQRTLNEVEKHTTISNWLLAIIIGLIFIISIISIISYIFIKTKIIKQMDALKVTENQLSELNATKDKLFSIIAHDLRSPFNTILGFSELLIETVKEFKVKESEKYLGFINSAAKNTLILLDNLLNWANSLTGQIKFNSKKIVLSCIIREIIDTSNSAAKIKNISLNQIQSDETEVYSDENMVKTVLRNLISNAIKFTKSGGKINVFVILKQNHIEITVSDNGVGMSRETCKKLFDLNTNVTVLGTENEKGSGLGLVLCKEFMEKLGGNIWVESELNKGSDFRFTIPLNK